MARVTCRPHLEVVTSLLSARQHKISRVPSREDADGLLRPHSIKSAVRRGVKAPHQVPLPATFRGCLSFRGLTFGSVSKLDKDGCSNISALNADVLECDGSNVCAVHRHQPNCSLF